MPAAASIPLAAILERLARGRDPQAWSELVEAVGPDLHRTACRLAGDASTADDAVQETFLLLRDRADQFRPQSGNADADARRWINRVGINVTLKLVRSRQRAASHERRSTRTARESAPGDAEDSLMAREQADLLRRALAKLPEPTRAAIVLHHLSGAGFSEVARHLDCPVGTAKARVHRGLAAMRGTLARQGLDLSIGAVVTGMRALPPTPAPAGATLASCHHLIASPLTASVHDLPSAARKGVPMAAKLGIGIAAVLAIAAAPFLLAQDGKPGPAPTPAPAADPPVASAPIPVPMTIADAGTYALVVIPDLRKACADCENTLRPMTPEPFTAGQAAEEIGALLGDPKLANLGDGAIVGVVGAGVPLPSFAVIVPAKNAQAYVDAAVTKGMAGKVVGTLAVLAQTPDGLDLGERNASSYRDISAVKPAADVRLVIAADRVAAAYGPFLQASARSFRLPNQQPMPPIVAFELAGLLATFSDVATQQIDLTLAADAVVGDWIVKAKPGSALEQALVAPGPASAATGRSRFDDHPGFLACGGRIPAQAVLAYTSHALDQLRATPEGKAVIPPDAIATLKRYARLATGDMAMRMRSSPQAPLLCDMAWGCSDVAQTRALYAEGMKQFTGNAAIFGDAGVSMRVEQGAGSVAGVPIDRVTYVIDDAKLGAAAAERLQAMVPPFELAFTDGFVFGSQEHTTLEAMVAGKPTGLILRAEQTIGSGRDGYFDFELIGFARYCHLLQAGIMPVIDPRPQSDPFAGIGPGEPLTGAWTSRDGRLRVEGRLPLKPIGELVKQLQSADAPAPQEPREPPKPKEF